MALRQNLLSEIRATLGSAQAPSVSTESDVSDLFEAYIFCLVLEAAKREGATVSFSSVDGSTSGEFVFRTSPGYLSSDRHNYGYAIITFADCPTLEAHVGVRVAGHSGVLHECDVSVLLQEEAELCRRSSVRVAPRSSKVVIALEVKFYTVALALHLGRAFLGLVRDFSSGSIFFVMNRSAPSIEKLLAHKRQLWEKEVQPRDSRAVKRLRNALQICFRDFQARSST